MIRPSATFVALFLFIPSLLLLPSSLSESSQHAEIGAPYPCEKDLIEVMFSSNSEVRMRQGRLVDLKTAALGGMDQVLSGMPEIEWYRLCDLSESRLDEIHARGEANTGRAVYNLNNIYRLRIPAGLDIWAVSKELESLPGIMSARPVPKPTPPPVPDPISGLVDYVPLQGYLGAASLTPAGIDAEYAWRLPGGDGTGVTVCDLEYFWDYDHTDISKASGSQINSLVSDAGFGPNHGTAVIGTIVSDRNDRGTTGICYGASLKTCGVFFGSPDPTWNVPGAIAVAIANLSAGDVILLEQQWDYSREQYVPIEWWGDSSPGPQSYNPVYAAIVNAVSNGIHVVEAGGNGDVNTDELTWYGDSGAIIVGAGGVYPYGTFSEGNLQRLSFSSHGSRFDLQGWGEDVFTTGYGFFPGSEEHSTYTSWFNGTSSAAATVAGAVACCSGFWTASGGAAASLPPAVLRDILVDSGSPQLLPPVGRVGPRPDLKAAFGALESRLGDGSRVWNVPSQIPTIQAAIDTAASGDTVAVGPGTYHERLSITGKNLVLIGTNGAENTLLSGATLWGDGRSILTMADTDFSTVITGLSFEDNGGDSARSTMGGGIHLDGDNAPQIISNVFRRNFAEYGGAICWNGNGAGPRIQNNLFLENTAYWGGAIEQFFACGSTISGNIFQDNACLGFNQGIGNGGAIQIEGFSCDSTYIAFNVFFRNRSGYGGAIGANGGRLLIHNNTFYQNEATYDRNNFGAAINLIYSDATADIRNNILSLTISGWAVAVSNGASASFYCNDFWINEDGDYREGPVGPTNLQLDPLLCDPLGGDLSLAPNSPCLPSNSPTCGLIGALGVGCDATPVRLDYLTALWHPDGALLRWGVTEITDHAGFHVYRGPEARHDRLTDQLLTSQSEYEFIDAAAPKEGAEYWLAEISRTGETTWHGPAVLPPASLPARLVLSPPAPNPFTSATRITYSLPTPQHVTLAIYDIQGRLVFTLVDEEQGVGEYTVSWDGRRAASGLYFVRLEAGGVTRTQKLMFVR